MFFLPGNGPDLQPLFQQIPAHAAAHDAHTDKTDFHSFPPFWIALHSANFLTEESIIHPIFPSFAGFFMHSFSFV